MSNVVVRVQRVACVAVFAAGALLASCARHEVDHASYGGSIKDDPVAAPASDAPPRKVPVARLAKPAEKPVAKADRSEPQPPATAAKASEPAAAAAAAKPVPGAGTPPAASAPPSAAAQPAPRTAPAPDERATSRQLLADGRQLFAAGKVVDARRRFIAALSGSSPEATWALAQSFDPHYLADLKNNDATADAERAFLLYQSAVERGRKAPRRTSIACGRPCRRGQRPLCRHRRLPPQCRRRRSLRNLRRSNRWAFAPGALGALPQTPPKAGGLWKP
jgi:hypothetical protein